jgi:uncharacterized protein DUF2695
MNTATPIVTEAETFVRDLAAELADPRKGECLCCYLARMLPEFGCDGTHRLTSHYRDTTAPRATTLRDRLSRMGACCCDCEVLSNAYQLACPSTATPPAIDDSDLTDVDEAIPPCRGVRRGSVRPCANWVRVVRLHLWA